MNAMCTSGGIMQNMGTASKIIRLMILILLVIILWRIWFYIIPSPKVGLVDQPNLIVSHVTDPRARGNDDHKELEIAVSSQLRVAVYYEALCPDSRDFVVKELEPAYKDLHEIIALDLIPYGKATSDVAKDGSKTFHCQHGPKECNANIVHACVSKYVKDKQLSLDVIGCMIDINYRRIDPVKAGEKCVYKSPLQELWPSIEKCSTGDEGKDLLYHMGKMTHDLGTINFIPAITVNDSRSNQNQILRNLKKYLCDTYAGPIIPVACKKL